MENNSYSKGNENNLENQIPCTSNDATNSKPLSSIITGSSYMTHKQVWLQYFEFSIFYGIFRKITIIIVKNDSYHSKARYSIAPQFYFLALIAFKLFAVLFQASLNGIAAALNKY
ncbi:hypothetical protein BpHYR1_035780 [Brachionus plicatilis]|uniref:Uncharacterized protein n=1 Tax=Brachionus plicatilis TaxID=10195 RepID=A0A3M7RFA5_BRAPC|nr:hypothetical protein BpHYR1_035780 [Brachionus plicatilis]